MTTQGPEAEETQRSHQTDEAEAEAGGPTQEAVARGRRLRALEAVLFMAAEPLASEELGEILDVSPREAEAIAQELAAACADRGLEVTRIAGGWQMVTRAEYGPYVAKLHKPERFRLSRAALETLAIVAYRQPVTRPEVDAIRGVNSDSPLDTLLQYELVCEAGRKETPGRPVLYRTTESFLGHFGLNSIEDLPRLDAIPTDEDEVRAEVGLPPAELEADEIPPSGEAAESEQPTGLEPALEQGDAVSPAAEAGVSGPEPGPGQPAGQEGKAGADEEGKEKAGEEQPLA